MKAAVASVWRCPVAVSGRAARPRNRSGAIHSTWPWRVRITVVIARPLGPTVHRAVEVTTGSGTAEVGASCCRVLEGRLAGEASGLPQPPFDPQQLIKLGDALAAAAGAGLQVPRAGGDGEVGDRRILGLARAVRDEAVVVMALRQLDGGERLGHRPDL